ncbi:hypothetical protein HY641_02820 [Candidatus Woesearchaeota archaeon]|nr:hypothetical protein [Candidatus Woesearchaeota archaeon]
MISSPPVTARRSFAEQKTYQPPRRGHPPAGRASRGGEIRLITITFVLTLVLIVMTSVAIAIPPILPEQIFGTVNVNGAPIPDGNLIEILASDGSFRTTSLTKQGKYGYDPIIAIPVRTDESAGLAVGSSLLFFVNGQRVTQKGFEPAQTNRFDLEPTGPVCGIGACQSGEDCIRCPQDCQCQNTPLPLIPRANELIIGALPGIDITIDSTTSPITTRFTIAGQAVVDIFSDLITTPLDLTTIRIEKTRSGNRNILLVNFGGPKILYLDKTPGTTAVCILDRHTPAITDISLACTSPGEIPVTCNAQLHGPYTCTDEGTRFRVTGLLHSIIAEMPPSITAFTTTPPPPVQQPMTSTTSRGSRGLRPTTIPPQPQPLALGNCVPLFTCTNFRPCEREGFQTRSCIDKNNCGTTIGKPQERQACTYKPGPIIPPQPQEQVPIITTTPPLPALIPPTPPLTPPLQQAAPQPAQPPPIIETPKASSMWQAILIGAGIGFLGVLLIYMIKRRKA